MEQRDRRGGQEYVDKDENFKSRGEIRVSDPWELNPPKNQRIPRRNQEIANGETWGALTVALEKWRVKG
jgi:hypothetical protein